MWTREHWPGNHDCYPLFYKMSKQIDKKKNNNYIPECWTDIYMKSQLKQSIEWSNHTL